MTDRGLQAMKVVAIPKEARVSLLTKPKAGRFDEPGAGGACWGVGGGHGWVCVLSWAWA